MNVARKPVLVDTGAWLALALTADPQHRRAVELWDELLRQGARLVTTVPIVLETFTFLDRRTRRDVALTWKDSLSNVPWFRLVECTTRDVEAGWAYFRRRDLHKLSAVDATSFAIMGRLKIAHAFSFDHHFAAVGFALIA